MTALVESKDYKIAAIVFSRSQFKKEEMKAELESRGIQLSMEELTEILEDYRDEGLIAKVGSAYAINY